MERKEGRREKKQRMRSKREIVVRDNGHACLRPQREKEKEKGRERTDYFLHFFVPPTRRESDDVGSQKSGEGERKKKERKSGRKFHLCNERTDSVRSRASKERRGEEKGGREEGKKKESKNAYSYFHH